jgi:hypothetical protein
MKSKEEIEKLKIDWHKDPCWDIETTEGFEEHQQELLEYRKACESKWKVIAEERKKETELKKPAFPSLKAKYGYEGEYEGLEEDEEGMTLRDYFAGQALSGIISSDCSDKMAVEPRAKLAYRIADAMLAERDKQ